MDYSPSYFAPFYSQPKYLILIQARNNLTKRQYVISMNSCAWFCFGSDFGISTSHAIEPYSLRDDKSATYRCGQLEIKQRNALQKKTIDQNRVYSGIEHYFFCPLLFPAILRLLSYVHLCMVDESISIFFASISCHSF